MALGHCGVVLLDVVPSQATLTEQHDGFEEPLLSEILDLSVHKEDGLEGSRSVNGVGMRDVFDDENKELCRKGKKKGDRFLLCASKMSVEVDKNRRKIKRTYGIHLVRNVANHDRGTYVNSVTNVTQVDGVGGVVGVATVAARSQRRGALARARDDKIHQSRVLNRL